MRILYNVAQKTRAMVSKGNIFCDQFVRLIVKGVVKGECLQQRGCRFALIEAIANIIFVFVVNSSSALYIVFSVTRQSEKASRGLFTLLINPRSDLTDVTLVIVRVLNYLCEEMLSDETDGDIKIGMKSDVTQE